MRFPSINSFEGFEPGNPISLICAAGFEDRVEAVFEELRAEGHGGNIHSAVSIHYEPEVSRNKDQFVNKQIEDLGISPQNHHKLEFDRKNPSIFTPSFRNVIDELTTDEVLLDVTGMSKYLIMMIMELLSNNSVNVQIFYAEAETYHPTKDQFKRDWDGEPDEIPAFLTSDIYRIVTTPLLSSAAKSGQPVVVVAFPNFNYQKMMALASELSPHHLIAIEGDPHLKEDNWRSEAIYELNSGINSYIHTEWKETSTFYYRETIELLIKLYEEYGDAYRIVLAPTGSKLQTIGASVFRQVHDDIQVVYPVVDQFDEKYTDGWKATWHIDLGDLSEISQRHSPTADRLNRLKDKIDRLNAEFRKSQRDIG